MQKRTKTAEEVKVNNNNFTFANLNEPSQEKFLLMKTKVSLIISMMLMCVCFTVQAQEIKGKPIAEIFTDFHVNINDTTQNTGFGLNRAYMGYQFLPGGNLSAKLIVNIGEPDELPAGSEPRRYAYYREASISWSDDRLTISMGITGTRIFEFQQKFWGKRYIANTYQSINDYGFVADLGVSADYIFNEVLKADLTIMNGEGYSNLQNDNNLRYSVGFTITPEERIAIRLYGDIQKQETLWQPVLIGFIGFRNSIITIGGELSYKSNIDINRGHHAWGFSATGGINITGNTEIFGRYDFISSVVMSGDALKWNYLNDGSFMVAGIQRTLSSNIKLAFNYQGYYPYSTSRQVTDMFYLNALFKF